MIQRLKHTFRNLREFDDVVETLCESGDICRVMHNMDQVYVLREVYEAKIRPVQEAETERIRLEAEAEQKRIEQSREERVQTEMRRICAAEGVNVSAEELAEYAARVKDAIDETGVGVEADADTDVDAETNEEVKTETA